MPSANGSTTRSKYTSRSERPARSAPDPKDATPREVLVAFLRLGCLSFGGPVAHLGYFQRELVERRQWTDPATYAEIVSLSQSLPGPGSSQVGCALGTLRAGWLGGLAAWIGFTLPSALLMFACAYGVTLISGPLALSLIHGLQLVAVAVVAQAVVTMQRTLAPDLLRILIAIAAAATILGLPSQVTTLAALALGAVVGLSFIKPHSQTTITAPSLPLSRRSGLTLAGVFLLLLISSPLIARLTLNPSARIFAAFYRSGALVFGGGHVVLPMLEQTVVAPGWLTQSTFLAGYGAAQALPGPLFSFAAFLGAAIPSSPHHLLNGLTALVALFAPGLLLMGALLPFWHTLRSNRRVAAALAGINVVVVGILAAALVSPLGTSTLHRPVDFALALIAFALLAFWKVPIWLVLPATVAFNFLAGLHSH